MSYGKMQSLTIKKSPTEGTEINASLEQQPEGKSHIKHQRIITEAVTGDVKLSAGNITGVSKKVTPEQFEAMATKRNELFKAFSSSTTVAAPVGGSLVDEIGNFCFNSGSSSDEESSGFSPK